MEPRDIERIQALAAGDGELRRLWEQHREMEAELAHLAERRFLTPEEEVRRKQLQKAKLVGRDRIQTILDERT